MVACWRAKRGRRGRDSLIQMATGRGLPDDGTGTTTKTHPDPFVFLHTDLRHTDLFQVELDGTIRSMITEQQNLGASFPARVLGNFSITQGWSSAFRRFWAENRLKAELQRGFAQG